MSQERRGTEGGKMRDLFFTILIMIISAEIFCAHDPMTSLNSRTYMYH